jgi:hypothetical protein
MFRITVEVDIMKSGVIQHYKSDTSMTIRKFQFYFPLHSLFQHFLFYIQVRGIPWDSACSEITNPFTKHTRIALDPVDPTPSPKVTEQCIPMYSSAAYIGWYISAFTM